MSNPCRECIVTSMCEEGCPILIDYLKHKLTYKFIPASLDFIATRIRQGQIGLVENDTQLTSKYKPMECIPTKDYFVVKFSEMGKL